MSNFPAGHPESEFLLAYIDGELPARQARRIRRHLEACWQCRAEVEGFQNTVADCVDYRKSVLAEHLPPPPNPWQDLTREFARIDASVAREPAWGWLMRPRWAVAALAAAVLIFAVVYKFRQTPAVQAATLLQRAVVAARTDPRPVHRVQFRTRNQRFTRTIGRPSAVTSAAAPAVQAMFQAAHYDWDDPLSARSFQAWRGTVPGRKDEVATVADPQSPAESCYQIRTTAAEGDLAAASLTLRIPDLHPVEGRLEFRDQEWVELTEMTDASTPDDAAISVVNPVEHSMRPAVPSRPAAVAPGPSASISDELQVLAVLHQIGADLGDPVEITLSEEHVLVSGVGIAPERQRQIHAQLDSMPRVAVEFLEPAAPPAAPETAGPGDARAHAAAGMPPARLEEQLGGHAEFASFSIGILDSSEKTMAHAYALRKLAQSFPADSEASLDAGGRRLLRDMALDHVEAMSQELTGIRRNLAPVLAALGGSAPDVPYSGAAGVWQPAAEELFRASRRLEVLVSTLLGVTPGQDAGAGLPSEVLSVTNQLRADLDHCHLLLARQ